MAWYQCSCGFRKEVPPQFGDTVTSVIHLHRCARVDGTSAVAWMKEISVPVSADLDHPGTVRQHQPVA